jgi:hypothetical protein
MKASKIIYDYLEAFFMLEKLNIFFKKHAADKILSSFLL